MFTIVKNTDRYPGIGPEFPQKFQVVGLLSEQAQTLAYKLSCYEVGCDYAYYAEGDEDAQ